MELEQVDGNGYILVMPGYYPHHIGDPPAYKAAAIEFRGVRNARQFEFMVYDGQIREFAAYLSLISKADPVLREAFTKVISRLYFNISSRINKLSANADQLAPVLLMFADKYDEWRKKYGQ